MKFLCVECDEPMTLQQSRPPDDAGSLTVLFGCPRCGRSIAMLTNPWETEMVSSLGVKIGPEADPESAEAASRCPFSGMLQEMEDRREMEEQRAEPAAPAGPRWTAEALERLAGIPDFVRPMARQGVEHYAASNGYEVVDEKVLDEARQRFGM